MTAGRRLYQRYTYRAVVEHYGLRLCTDAATCRRRRSEVAHRYARGDSMGWFHMQDADTRKVTKKGMRMVLKEIASVKLDHYRRGTPTWQRLYEQDVWAWKEGDLVWKIRFPSSMSDKDRQRVLRSAAWNRVKLRSQHTAIYRWATTPLYAKEKVDVIDTI